MRSFSLLALVLLGFGCRNSSSSVNVSDLKPDELQVVVLPGEASYHLTRYRKNGGTIPARNQDNQVTPADKAAKLVERALSRETEFDVVTSRYEQAILDAARHYLLNPARETPEGVDMEEKLVGAQLVIMVEEDVAHRTMPNKDEATVKITIRGFRLISMDEVIFAESTTEFLLTTHPYAGSGGGPRAKDIPDARGQVVATVVDTLAEEQRQRVPHP